MTKMANMNPLFRGLVLKYDYRQGTLGGPTYVTIEARTEEALTAEGGMTLLAPKEGRIVILPAGEYDDNHLVGAIKEMAKIIKEKRYDQECVDGVLAENTSLQRTNDTLISEKKELQMQVCL